MLFSMSTATTGSDGFGTADWVCAVDEGSLALRLKPSSLNSILSMPGNYSAALWACPVVFDTCATYVEC